MTPLQKDFIDFLFETEAFKFGSFVTKKGRTTPYFVNTGGFYTGKSISLLASYYAGAIESSKIDFNLIYGPSYKGIPLAVSTVMSMYSQFNKNYNYSFNRKETKDHGESGLIVGKKFESSDKVIIIDDVISAGTSINESFEILKRTGDPQVVAVFIAVDRKEKGDGEISAIAEIENNYNVPVKSIVNIEDVIARGKEKGIFDGGVEKEITAYRIKYGII